jgi:hypothetical protein
MKRHLRKDDKKKCGKEAIFFKIITVPYYFLVENSFVVLVSSILLPCLLMK